jgi:enoyl-CoA hydratase/carnithine racemase
MPEQQLTTLSEPRPNVHVITLSSPPDNRLTPAFLQSLSSNLDIIERKWREKGGGASLPDPRKKDTKVEGGAVIITGQGRFFSNGLDYENATKDKRFFEGKYRMFWLCVQAGMRD